MMKLLKDTVIVVVCLISAPFMGLLALVLWIATLILGVAPGHYTQGKQDNV